jgi:hypothetical protein
MAPATRNAPAATQSRPEDVEILKELGIEPTGNRDVDNAIAKYAKRMGGQVDAIQNYRDAMLARAQAQT